jgi:hypothetical protein
LSEGALRNVAGAHGTKETIRVGPLKARRPPPAAALTPTPQPASYESPEKITPCRYCPAKQPY